jgi:putative transcriptional regulator
MVLGSVCPLFQIYLGFSKSTGERIFKAFIEYISKVMKMMISLIGYWIKKSPLSRPEICKIFGVSNNTLSNWCTGKTFPTIPQAFKLAELLNVKVDDLYEHKGE